MVKTCSRAVVVANAVSLASAGINKLAQTVLVGRGVGWFVLANCDRQFMNGFSWSICWLLIGQCQFAVPILSIIQFFKYWEQSIWLHCGKKSGMQWLVSRFFVRVYPLNGCNTLHGGVSRYDYCISPGRVAWCACRYANTRDCCWHTDSCNCLYWFSLYKESAIYRQSLLLLPVIVHFGLLKVMTRKLTWVNMLIVGFGRFVYLSVIKVNLIMFRSMSGRTIGLPSASGRCVVSLFAHWHFPLLIS